MDNIRLTLTTFLVEFKQKLNQLISEIQYIPKYTNHSNQENKITANGLSVA